MCIGTCIETKYIRCQEIIYSDLVGEILESKDRFDIVCDKAESKPAVKPSVAKVTEQILTIVQVSK